VSLNTIGMINVGSLLAWDYITILIVRWQIVDLLKLNNWR